MTEWIVKPCKGKELAKLYQISYKVFKKHLEPHQEKIGPRLGHFYMMHQVIMIIDILGVPPFGVKLIYPRTNIYNSKDETSRFESKTHQLNSEG